MDWHHWIRNDKTLPALLMLAFLAVWYFTRFEKLFDLIATFQGAVFGPGTGEIKKAAIMDFLKNAIGVGELALGPDLVAEAEFVAGLDQAAEGILRSLKATSVWQKSFPSSTDRQGRAAARPRIL